VETTDYGIDDECNDSVVVDTGRVVPPINMIRISDQGLYFGSAGSMV